MNSIKTIFLLTFIFVFNLKAQNEFYRFFVNNINLPIDNKGEVADVNIPPNGTLGRYNGIGFLFGGSFYITGYESDSLWGNGVLNSALVFGYQPGVVGSDPDAPENVIYVVSSSDPDFGPSWQYWSNAVDLGADFYDGNGDGIYDPVDLDGDGFWDPDEDKPDILGDLTAWCVYNDGIPDTLRRWEGDPLGIEIQQTMFAYKNSHPVFGNTENTIFIRYRIINKGMVVEKLDSVLFSLYADFDIGGDAESDFVGNDTSLSGGYAYKKASDSQFGDNPPAVFHHFIQNPHTYIPGETFQDNNGNGIYDPGTDIALDTADYFRGPDLGIRKIPGAKNQEFFSSIINFKNLAPNYSEPDDIQYARYNQLGLDGFGATLDPCGNNNLMDVFGNVDCEDVNPIFWGSGDPVTEQGWIDILGWDIRTTSTVGPFNLNAGDYYDIIVAYTLGQGTDPINSITVARQIVLYSKQCYNSNFGQFPVGVENDEQTVNEFGLYQNYPNPFNPTTTIKYAVSSSTDYQSVPVKIIVFDMLGREVTTLVNEVKQPGVFEVTFNASNLSSGVYIYRIQAGDFTDSKKMIFLR